LPFEVHGATRSCVTIIVRAHYTEIDYVGSSVHRKHRAYQKKVDVARSILGTKPDLFQCIRRKFEIEE